MKFIVCIKQVPVVSAMEFDRETKTLKREGVPSEVSSFDVRALLKAVESKKLHGGEITILTMGPPQARSALEHCLALGADRAIHLVDPAFAGSDTLATSRAIAMAIKREEFDLIFCGKNSVDAETGQVGPEIAELLNLPQITAVRRLTIDPASHKVVAERETDDGYETVECPLPALISAAEDLTPERFPSRAERERAKEKPVVQVKASELSEDLSLFGFLGSPTAVAAIETIATQREGKIIQSASVQDAVKELVGILLDRGLFGQWRIAAGENEEPTGREERQRSAGRDIWVVVEVLRGAIRPVSLELLGKGIELAERKGGELAAIAMGHRMEKYTGTLAAYGADRVYLADDPRLEPYRTEAHTAVLAHAIRLYRPGVVLIPSTLTGRDFAPRVAARLGLGLTGDCIDLGIDEKGRLLQYKPAFGGSVVAPILSRTSPEMATVRPGMLKKRRPDWFRKVRVEKLVVEELGAVRTTVARQVAAAVDAAEVDSADIVIGVGKGLGGPENLPLVRELADAVGAAIAATREVTDEGWLPKQYQVGLTGKAIAPRLYVAVGVSGAFEHLVGVRRAAFIVAINNNPKASIFQAADRGIVGGYAEVVPLLTKALITAKEQRQ